MKCFIPLMLAAPLAMPKGATAQVDLHPFVTDNVVIHAGGFIPNLNFELSVDGQIGGENLGFDFERDFDLQTSDEIFNGELNWRFGEKWSLRTQYFNGGRSGTTDLETTIDWGDEEFLIGTNIRVVTDLEIIRLFFGRALETRENVDAGIGFGVHHLDLSAAITGTINIDGVPSPEQTRTAGTAAFLPNIGGWYSWSWTRKWALTSRLDWLEASIGDLRGGIINFSAGVNYQIFNHVGLGLSYQDFTLRLRSHEKFWTGRTKLSYRGPFIYLTGNW